MAAMGFFLKRYIFLPRTARRNLDILCALQTIDWLYEAIRRYVLVVGIVNL